MKQKASFERRNYRMEQYSSSSSEKASGNWNQSKLDSTLSQLE